MSEEELLELAESGEWRDRAIEMIHRRSKAPLDLIVEFVVGHWQNLISDEENLHNFEIYESEYSEAFNY